MINFRAVSTPVVPIMDQKTDLLLLLLLLLLTAIGLTPGGSDYFTCKKKKEK
jgi:hypothetical protein